MVTSVSGLAGKWVDETHGVVARDAFLSDDIFRLELSRIFEKSWVYLAHESEIPEAGNFVARPLGNAPVVVVRDSDKSIHAVLNSCRHRGAKVCRAESGTIRRFVCPYHGWGYERNGKLITTTFDALLPKDMNFAEWGLVKVPRVEVYKGLIFGCWDPGVVSLEDYLGDFRWYLDTFFARTPSGMEVLAPPHRWRVKANWKVGSLNFIGDAQHILTTHTGPITLDTVRSARAGLAKFTDESVQVITDGGHGCSMTYLADELAEDHYQTHDRDLMALYAKTLKPEQNRLLRRLRVIVGTIFPNLSFIESQVDTGKKALILRRWHPISGTEMEILSWVLAERESSADYKQRVLNFGAHNFGAGGVFEQDDVELWAACTFGSDNSIARQFPYSFHTAVPLLDKPDTKYPGPGRAFRPTLPEVVQFEFMRHWGRLMEAAT